MNPLGMYSAGNAMETNGYSIFFKTPMAPKEDPGWSLGVPGGSLGSRRDAPRGSPRSDPGTLGEAQERPRTSQGLPGTPQEVHRRGPGTPRDSQKPKDDLMLITVEWTSWSLTGAQSDYDYARSPTKASRRGIRRMHTSLPLSSKAKGMKRRRTDRYDGRNLNAWG